MGETHHTPPLWEIRGNGILKGTRCVAIICTDRKQMDAAEIVTACNSHDALVRAVQALLKAYEQLMPGIGHIACSDYAVVNEAPILARAALAAVEQEQKG